MLQSLAGKLNRLNDVREIGATIVNELRMLVDYHSCRVYIADGVDLLPIAWRGDLGPYQDETRRGAQSRFGEGITGRAAETGQSLPFTPTRSRSSGRSPSRERTTSRSR